MRQGGIVAVVVAVAPISTTAHNFSTIFNHNLYLLTFFIIFTLYRLSCPYASSCDVKKSFPFFPLFPRPTQVKPTRGPRRPEGGKSGAASGKGGGGGKGGAKKGVDAKGRKEEKGGKGRREAKEDKVGGGGGRNIYKCLSIISV